MHEEVCTWWRGLRRLDLAQLLHDHTHSPQNAWPLSPTTAITASRAEACGRMHAHPAWQIPTSLQNFRGSDRCSLVWCSAEAIIGLAGQGSDVVANGVSFLAVGVLAELDADASPV